MRERIGCCSLVAAVCAVVLTFSPDSLPRAPLLPVRRVHESDMTLERFIEEHQLTFPVYVDSGPAQEALKIRMFPTTVLIDRRGTIRQVDVGVTSVAGLRGEIEALIDEP